MRKQIAGARPLDAKWTPMLLRTVTPVAGLEEGEVIAVAPELRLAWTARRVVFRGSRQLQQLFLSGIAGVVWPTDGIAAPRFPGRPLSRAQLRQLARQSARRVARNTERMIVGYAPELREIGLVR
jgi:hypothetical protein